MGLSGTWLKIGSVGAELKNKDVRKNNNNNSKEQKENIASLELIAKIYS